MFARVVKSTQIGNLALKQYSRLAACSQIRQYSDVGDGKAASDSSEPKAESNSKLGSFAKAFEDLEKINEPVVAPVENIPFKKLLRESKLVDVSFFHNNLVFQKKVFLEPNVRWNF